MINAIEAKFQLSNELENNVLIIMEGVSNGNLEQTQLLILKDDWDEINILSNTRNRWFYRRSTVSQINTLLDQHININMVFIGEYRSILMRHVCHRSKAKYIYLLDDGNYSLYIQKQLLSRSGEYNPYNLLRRIYSVVLNISDHDLFDIFYFSVYDNNINDKNSYKFIKNNYYHLKKKIVSKKTKNEVFFIGNITSELKIISEEYYFIILKAAINYYNNQNYKVVYIPHRRENKDKLDVLSNKLSIEIRSFNKPVEQAIIENSYFPIKIASFFSSALDNCYYLFGNKILIDAFFIHKEKIQIEEHRARIKLNYETYETYDSETFNIIYLDEYFNGTML